ncbi:TIGR03564 family F420-dependent LLM class oxidoreductase [Planomonospora algeriensis]
MRIGLFVNEPKSPDVLGKLREKIARGADEGFTSAWVSHIFGLDALTALAVAGAAVPGIELGTAVVPTYPRHPAALAQQALTANAALDGRLTLGIGLSHQMVIEGMFGYSYDRPARHMREYLSVLMPLARGENVTFEGETITARIGLSTPGSGDLPVLVAALAPRMLKLAGEVADGTVLWMTGPRTVAEHIAPAVTEARGRRPPRAADRLRAARLRHRRRRGRAGQGGQGVRRLRAAAVLPGGARPGGRGRPGRRGDRRGRGGRRRPDRDARRSRGHRLRRRRVHLR